MKNISRRVFIKGMAVAAVATAASTVLAGCNLPAGTENGTPVAGFSPITKTLTVDADEEQTLSVTAKGVEKLYDNNVKVELAFTNETDRTVYFVDPSDSTYGAYETKVGSVRVQAVAFFDDKMVSPSYPVAGLETVVYNKAGTIGGSGFKFNGKDDATGVTSTYAHEGNLYFKTPKEWSKMTVVLSLKDVDDKTQEVQYVINNG